MKAETSTKLDDNAICLLLVFSTFINILFGDLYIKLEISCAMGKIECMSAKDQISPIDTSGNVDFRAIKK